MTPKAFKGFAVCDKEGNIVHTTVSLYAKDAIEEWLHQDEATYFIGNMGRRSRGEAPACRPSWEHYEAEGYCVVNVLLLGSSVVTEPLKA